MSVVVSHPTGNANLRAVLRGLHQRRLLHTFYTTIAIPSMNWSKELISESLYRRIGQRCFPEVPWSKVRLQPFREIVRLTARFLNISTLINNENAWASIDSVYASLDLNVAESLVKNNNIRAVYAYEDGALHSFRKAKKMGILSLYDLPIAHWRTLRRLLQEEAERLPEWSLTMPGLRDSVAKLERKDEEILLSDHVFVASQFTKASLTEHFGDSLKILIVPYGCPVPFISHPTRREKGEPLHLFYAGQLSQRKGIADLIAALDRLEVDWRITLAGTIQGGTPKDLSRLLSDSRCHWLGFVPQLTLLEAMSRAHVFVFPSIVEGFGMVITEALSSGLPVITTSNTAGPDILTEGYNGYIVPIRNPDAIAEKITILANDETLRYEMAYNALQTAKKFTWQKYETQIANLVEENISRNQEV